MQRIVMPCGMAILSAALAFLQAAPPSPRERRRSGRSIPSLIVMPASEARLALATKDANLAKEAVIEMEGTVQEVLPNTQFRVRLTNGADVLAYAGGKMRQRRIRIIAGDRVSLEVSPYDLTRGRINYRHLDSPAPVAARRRFPYKKR